MVKMYVRIILLNFELQLNVTKNIFVSTYEKYLLLFIPETY